MKPAGLARFLKRGRTGQSIVILALGFIALIAFVGIVTDVSLLFVRYSTLRRAVDAAAVAAATQMRRVENTSSTPGVDTGGSTSVANMNLAARQFLNLYSLDPSDVTVETCQSQMVEFQEDGPNKGQPIFTGIFDDNHRMVMSPEQQEKNYNDVCKDGRKLVRVTASIQSPTVFLRMLGMQDVTLTVSSISETAVLDVALVLDVSESMLSETSYSDYEAELGHPVARILPGRGPVSNNDPDLQWWNLMNQKTESQIEAYATDPVNADGAPLHDDVGADLWTEADDDPNSDVVETVKVAPIARVKNADNTYTTIDPANWDDPGSPLLRKECRTRFWPNAQNILFGAGITQPMLQDYRDYFFDDGSGNYATKEKAYFNLSTVVANPVANPSVKNDPSNKYVYNPFIPTFDYFGCCNDPNGDFDFSDLVCQPMKQARDASVDFLRRVDFPRGDAVAVITFSQSAYVIRPNGPGTDPWIRGDQQLATNVVQQAVGVRAEPVYYYDNPASYGEGGNRYQWDTFNVGSDQNGNPIRGGYADYWNVTPINAITTFPVHNNCPFDDATLLYPQYNRAGNQHPLLFGIQTPPWSVALNPNNSFDQVKRTYDYRGSCRDTNMGGALAASGNIFSELGQNHTEGSVWVMVLLSDGAAGATNPITKHDNPHIVNGETTYQQQQSNPYGFTDVSSDIDSQGWAIRDFDNMGDFQTRLGAEYGSFGFCPYGTQANPTRLVTQGDFPYCSDIYPNSRHSCASTEPDKQNPPNNPVYIDLDEDTNTIGCKLSYDPDDFARDWADYVAGVTQQNVSTTQLPVIFTIGFNLTYPNKNGCGDATSAGYATCLRNNNHESFLGEELLRYIGDAGDNFRIDDDFWQYQLSKLGVFADVRGMGTSDLETFYGQPGPCENPDEDPITTPPNISDDGTSDNHQMLAPGLSCGNYFNAPGQTELAEVFNEIASRMFTRLSQ